MIILLSPAKTQDFNNYKYYEFSETPRLSEYSTELIKELKKLDVYEIAELMEVSKNIAEINFARFKNFDFEFKNNVKPAIEAFKGDVYTDIMAENYNEQEIIFAQKHLRIISGLYGLLRAYDLIQPYRLEMKTKLKIGTYNNLYQFWGDKITDLLNQDLKMMGNKIVLNLASVEYFSAINKSKVNGKIINLTFKEYKDRKHRIVAIYAKRARGMMANFIVQNFITEIDQLKSFRQNNYIYNIELSTPSELVFTR